MAIVQDGLHLWYDGINNAGEGVHDETATTWTDLSGNGNDGAVAVASWADHALLFNGKTNWVNCGEFNPSHATIEAVVEFNTVGGTSETSYEYNAVAGNWQAGGFGIQQKNRKNSAQFNVGGTWVQVYGSDSTITKRIHLTATFDGSTAKIYEDGVLVSSEPASGSIKAPTYNTVFSIGSNPKEDGIGITPLSGYVCAVRLYDRALTDAEVHSNYQHDASRFPDEDDINRYGLMLWYDGINNAGEGVHDETATTWTDLSGNGNDGIVAVPTWENQCLFFDGRKNWVNCGNQNPSYATIEAIVQFNDCLPVEGKGYNAVAGNWQDYGFGIQQESGKNGGQVSTGLGYTKVYGSECALNKIVHLTLSYDGSSVRFYEDGVLKSSKSDSGKISAPNDDTVFAIGSNPIGNDMGITPLYGYVFSVRLYNRGLADGEVLRNYNVEKDRFHEVVPDLYQIRKTTLTALADQARRLGNVSDPLTPNQMIAIFSGLTSS